MEELRERGPAERPERAPRHRLPPRAPPAEVRAPRDEDAPLVAESALLEHSLAPRGETADGEPRVELERYDELELIGSGGSGVVTVARDRETGARVAIKRLRPEARGQAARFLREAEAIAALDHPGIVRLHQVIGDPDAEGPVALVLELVEGPTLEQLVRREGTTSVRQALEIGLEVARALGHAHGRGVVHRDVKPTNILLTAEGRPKVADFGLALASSAQVSLTQSGAVLGTLDYMAPEQWSAAHTVDARADVYGLGATLYRLVTGGSPRVIREGRIPDGARRLILRAVEERPADRYPTMEAMARDLQGALARALADSSGVHAPLERVAADLRHQLDQARQTGDARRVRVAAVGLQALGLLEPGAVRDVGARLDLGSPLETIVPPLVDEVLRRAQDSPGASRSRLLADGYAVLAAALAPIALDSAARAALGRLRRASQEPAKPPVEARLALALERLAAEGALRPADLRGLAIAGRGAAEALTRALTLLRVRSRATSDVEWPGEHARWRRALTTLAAALPEPHLTEAIQQEQVIVALEAASRRAAAAEAAARQRQALLEADVARRAAEAAGAAADGDAPADQQLPGDPA